MVDGGDLSLHRQAVGSGECGSVQSLQAGASPMECHVVVSTGRGCRRVNPFSGDRLLGCGLGLGFQDAQLGTCGCQFRS